MKYVWKFAGVYLAFIVQSLFLENLKIFSCSPDILITCVIICSVSMSATAACGLGAFAGVLMDAMYGEVFGINILVYMYMALLVSLATDKGNSNSPLIMSWICFVSVAAMEIALPILKAIMGSEASIRTICAGIFVKGIFSAVFALVWVVLFQYLKKRKKEKNTDSISSEKGAEV